MVELYIYLLKKWYDYTANIPNFVFLGASGMLGQGIISWLHRSNRTPPAPVIARDPYGQPISRAALEAAVRARSAARAEAEAKARGAPVEGEEKDH